MAGPAKLNNDTAIPYGDVTLDKLIFFAPPSTGQGQKNTLQALFNAFAATSTAPVKSYADITALLANTDVPTLFFGFVSDAQDDPAVGSAQWGLYLYQGGDRDELASYTLIMKESALSGGGGSNIEIIAVNTTGGTITLPFGDEEEEIFVGMTSFATAKDIALTDTTNAKRLNFSFNITNTAAVLTFPSDFAMNDVRWDSGTKEFTPDNTGVHRGVAIFDGSRT